MTSGSPTTPKIENSAMEVRVVEQLRKLADEEAVGVRQPQGDAG